MVLLLKFPLSFGRVPIPQGRESNDERRNECSHKCYKGKRETQVCFFMFDKELDPSNSRKTREEIKMKYR